MQVSRAYGVWFQVGGFALLSVVYLFWTWSHVLGDYGGDNAVYLFMAQYYSPWGGYSELAAMYASLSQFPPLYPFLLGLFHAGGNILVAHIVTTGFLLLALVAFYFWLRAFGLSALLASVTTLLFALLPGTYFQALSIHSENLYLLLSLVCLAATARAESDGRDHWLWVAAIAVAGVTLTRSAGISLLAAFIVYLILNRGVGGWKFMLAAAAPMVLWSLVSGQLQRGYLSSLAHNYGSDLLDALVGQLSVGARMIWYGWLGNFTTSSALAPAVAVIGTICLAGMAYRLYLRKLDGFYVLFYLLLIMVWPFPAESQRFLFVIVPILMVQGMVLVRDRIRPSVRGRVLDLSLLIYMPALALIALPVLALTVARFAQPLPEPFAEYKHTVYWYEADPYEAYKQVMIYSSLAASMREIQSVIPEDECVYSIKPTIVSLYSNRLSITPPREATSDLEFHESLRKSNCRYFYMAALASPSYGSPYYPEKRLRDNIRVLRITYLPGNREKYAALLAEMIRK